jgi:hypothetical protein
MRRPIDSIARALIWFGVNQLVIIAWLGWLTIMVLSP